jgi:hypothetical protein
MTSASAHLIEQLAATMHENYRRQAAKHGWPVKAEVDRPYAELSPEFQKANIDGALRIPEVLGVLGLRVVPVSEVEEDAQKLTTSALGALIGENLETLSLAEHKGWLRQRQEAGWVWAAQRDDARKQHPSIKPYEKLSDVEKEKDRNQVRSYPGLLENAGMVAVK